MFTSLYFVIVVGAYTRNPPVTRVPRKPYLYIVIVVGAYTRNPPVTRVPRKPYSYININIKLHK